jgi:cell division septation protein DedD
MDAGGDRPGTGRPEAGRWPDDAEVVALVVPSDAGPEACELAAEAAEESRRDRRTLLANLAGPSPDLDGHLGAAAEEGLFDAGRSGRSLREIAVRPPGRRFVYLPAGRAGRPAGDDRAVRARLAGLMTRVAGRVRDRGGRLLLFLSEEGGWPEALPGLLDGVVLLEGAVVPADWDDRAPEVLGRRPPETPEADGDRAPADASDREGPDVGAGAVPAGLEAPADPGPEGPDAWRRHRRSAGFPWARVGLGAAAVLALAAGWWWLVREAGPATGSGGDAAAVEVAVDSTAETAGGADAGADGGPGDAAPDGSRSGAAALEAAPELPYSVLIASYAEWSQARRRLEAWRDPSGPVYFVAPTRIRGGLYWRLFAGAEADRASGEALMEELVEQGRKDRVRTWDVRPVEFAFLTGTAGSRSGARSRVREMEERGLPAYTLPAASGADTTWAVWAGGFESREEASDLRALLRDAEIEAELVTRRGESDTR